MAKDGAVVELRIPEEQMKVLEDIRLKMLTIEARVNALEAHRDNDETYRMEQNERR